MRPGSTYCFIDGAYFRREHAETLKAIFNQEPDLMVDGITNIVRADKYFYYDCIDDLKRTSETDTQLQERVKSEDMRMNAISSLPGFHVQLGSLSGTDRRRRQKQVDVLLAVDMLSHAHNRNMQNAILVAGDLDFRPAVEKLISQHGIYVTVLHGKRPAQELCWAADETHQLNSREMHICTSSSFRAKYPLPDSTQPIFGVVPQRSGTLAGREAILYDLHGSTIEFEAEPGARLAFFCSDRAVLERYLEYEFGPLAWSEPPRW